MAASMKYDEQRRSAVGFSSRPPGCLRALASAEDSGQPAGNVTLGELDRQAHGVQLEQK